MHGSVRSDFKCVSSKLLLTAISVFRMPLAFCANAVTAVNVVQIYADVHTTMSKPWKHWRLIVDYVYKHSYWNSLDVHDIVKRVIEFVKTLKNIKKDEMKFEQCYWFLSRMLIYLMRQRTMKMNIPSWKWFSINIIEML